MELVVPKGTECRDPGCPKPATRYLRLPGPRGDFGPFCADHPAVDLFAGEECPNCGDPMAESTQFAYVLGCSNGCGTWTTPYWLREIRKEGSYQSCMGCGCGFATAPRGWSRCPLCGNIDRDSATIFRDWNHPERADERSSTGRTE